MKLAYTIGLLFSSALAAASCGSGELSDEDVASTATPLTKCQSPTANGNSNFCDDPLCPCTLGEGDCDQHTQCSAPYKCIGKAAYFGFPSGDYCAGPYCSDKKKDWGETAVDCGGPCGSNNCPADVCAGLPANGTVGHCTTTCPCPAGGAHCANSQDCYPGLVCGVRNGAAFGFSSTTNVCIGAHCGNSVLDGDETETDCGGSCAPCGQTQCQKAGAANGSATYCDNPLCPCTLGEGDCDQHTQCSAPYKCIGKAAYFGFPSGDYCAGPYCSDKKKDWGETAVDCGGPCGSNNCPADVCAGLPANGTVGHCTTTCPCPAGGAACTSAVQCYPGLVCATGKGPAFGFSSTTNVCLGAHCSNGVLDGDETGADCGGSCVPCGGGATATFRAGGPSNDVGNDFAYDSKGNIVIAGRFSGTVDFGGGPLTSAGLSDIFLAKYSPSGAHIWSKRFGSTGPDGDYAVSVSTDRYDGIYLGGDFYGSVDFGGGARTAAGNPNAFVARFDPNGAHLMSKAFGGPRGNLLRSIRVTWSTGVIYVAGAFQESINLGGTTFTVATPGAATWDIFAARLTVGATHVWSRGFGSAGDDQGLGVALDTNGDAYVAGYFSTGTDFGAGPVTTVGSTDAFGMKLNGTTGATQWVKTWGGTSDDHAASVAIGNNLKPVFSGYFKGSINLSGTTVTSAGGTQAFVVALDQVGTHQWSSTFGGAGDELITSSAILAASNEVVVAGYYGGTMNPGGGNLTSAGLRDIFLVKYSATGGQSWQASYGGTGDELTNGVAIFGQNVGVTGFFTGTSSFGSSAGGYDVFVGSYAF